jgi:hypothetical protein
MMHLRQLFDTRLDSIVDLIDRLCLLRLHILRQIGGSFALQPQTYRSQLGSIRCRAYCPASIRQQYLHCDACNGRKKKMILGRVTNVLGDGRRRIYGGTIQPKPKEENIA